MSDIDAVAATLSPDEQKFFDTGGESGLPDAGQGDAGTTTTSNDAATAPETGKAGEGDKDGADKVEKMVSLSALHEERGRRREEQKRSRDLETQLAELRGKFSIIERINAPPQQTAPDPETDFLGAVRHQGETVAQLQKRLDDQEAARKAEQDQAKQTQSLISGYSAAAAEFEQRTPDFKAAYQHLLHSRVQELSALGYDGEAIRQTLQNEEMAIAQTAFRNERNPGEVIYELAKHRGYVKKAEPPPGGGKGSAADKLDTIERGQGLHKSLSSTGGSSGDVEMTADALLKMPMDEFEAWCAKNPAKAKRLMGG